MTNSVLPWRRTQRLNSRRTVPAFECVYLTSSEYDFRNASLSLGTAGILLHRAAILEQAEFLLGVTGAGVLLSELEFPRRQLARRERHAFAVPSRSGPVGLRQPARRANPDRGSGTWGPRCDIETVPGGRPSTYSGHCANPCQTWRRSPLGGRLTHGRPNTARAVCLKLTLPHPLEWR